jgi:mRNA-degrading endonuclease YafQ of YafQ-DinJ toxin-antitoxin module
MTAYSETQIVQCPNQKSFDDHHEVWPDIIEIGKRHSCSLEWEIRSSQDLTYNLKFYLKSRLHQQNAMVEVMTFLAESNIEPCKIVDSDHNCEGKLKELKRLLRLTDKIKKSP